MVKFWLINCSYKNMTCVLRMFDSLDLQDVPQFDSLIISNIFLCNFLPFFFFFFFGWQHLLPWVSTRQVGLICFCIFKSSVLVFCRKSLFVFCLTNSECDTYLATDHSLVYSGYPKMFLLFYSLIFSLV